MPFSTFADMLDKNLIVRDLNSYARKIGTQLRSENYQYKEEEREILMGLMHLKFKDEKRHLRELKRKKEACRQELIKRLGKGRRLDNVLAKLRKDVNKLKVKLKRKYKAKLTHLQNIRKEETDHDGIKLEVEVEIWLGS